MTADVNEMPNCTFQQREGSIHKLHLDTLQRLLCRGDIQKMQDDWLIVAKHASTGYLRTESIADLTYTAEHSRFDLAGDAVGEGLQSRSLWGAGLYSDSM